MDKYCRHMRHITSDSFLMKHVRRKQYQFNWKDPVIVWIHSQTQNLIQQYGKLRWKVKINTIKRSQQYCLTTGKYINSEDLGNFLDFHSQASSVLYLNRSISFQYVCLFILQIEHGIINRYSWNLKLWLFCLGSSTVASFFTAAKGPIWTSWLFITHNLGYLTSCQENCPLFPPVETYGGSIALN